MHADFSLSDSDEMVETDEDTERGPFCSVGKEYFEPLYGGAPIMVLDSHLLILQYSLRHSLTKKALEELLRLVAAQLPDAAKIPPSVYKLKTFFVNLSSPEMNSHKYCSTCHELLDDCKPCRDDM